MNIISRKIGVPFFVSLLFLSACGSPDVAEKTPQEIVQEGLIKLASQKKLQFDLSVTSAGETEDALSQSVTLEGRLTGASEVPQDETKGKPKLHFALASTMNIDDGTGSGEILGRLVDEVFYVNLKKVDLSGKSFKNFPQKEWKKIAGRWYSLKADAKEDPLEAKEFLKELKNLGAKLKELQLFTKVMEDGEEEIRGLKTTKYRVQLNWEEVKEFLVESERVAGNILTPEEEQAAYEGLAENDFTGFVWIGKDDGAVHRISGTVTKKSSDTAGLGTLAFDFTFWDFGKPVSVSVPEDVEPLPTDLFFPQTPQSSEKIPVIGDDLGAKQVK